jgi:DNA polymerase I
MKLIFDIETDGLLDTITKVWCIVAIDEEGTVHTFEPDNIKEGVKFLSQAEELIGHNIIGFDLEALRMLHKFNFSGTVTDTLVCSRTIWSNLAEIDFNLTRKSKDFPSNLIGSHSLKAWGYRLGKYKGEYTDFSQYAPAMLDYCVQDVHVTKELYDKIINKGFSEEALDLEHKLHTMLITQEKRGFPFDEKGAMELFAVISHKREELYTKLVETFEPTIVQLKTKQKVIPFNPASRQQIADRLMKKGWAPKVFSNTGEPKVDEAVLSTIKLPEAALLSEYLMLNKRIGQLSSGKQAWLKLLKQGRIHGSVNHMGAVTSRCTHNNPNVAQVPNSSAPFGTECRALFTAGGRGYKLVGADASGLELRCLAHYMAIYDGGAYANEVVSGDIHTANQKAAGLETRNQAKTFIYGFLYGAGDEKIGKIIGKGEREGKKIKKSFLTKTPALKKLREAVSTKAETSKVLKGLDGRIIPVRHKHAALNTLLQSAGAIVCKTWYVLIAEEMVKRGIEGYIAGFIHDEVQIIVSEHQAEAMGAITKQMMKEVEKHFNFRCPLDSEFKIGDNWAQTH